MKFRQKGRGGRLAGWLWALWLGLVLGAAGCTPGGDVPPNHGVYTEKAPSPEGTGRVYMGREIAGGLVHAYGAGWLERAGRATTERPDRLLHALALADDDVVADVGAGTGYLTFPLAERVPQGHVFAIEIDPALHDTIRHRRDQRGLTNVILVLGTETDPNLPPDSVDVALIVDSYHEFSFPFEMVAHLVAALRPGGRLVLVEYRGEDATLAVPALHRMTEAQARAEMAAVGLVWRETREVLPQQHFMVFEKPLE